MDIGVEIMGMTMVFHQMVSQEPYMVFILQVESMMTDPSKDKLTAVVKAEEG